MSGAAAIWHDVECGSYDADLELWDRLAQRHGGPVLDLGCGTGRVSLHLARRGHRVIAIDRDGRLLAALEERAGGLPLEAVHADARELALGERVPLALAPMQLLQLLPGKAERLACLRRVAAALRPGGLFAAAIVDGLPETGGEPSPVPDVREVDGWVYSSLPVAVAAGGERILLRRLRQTVSPAGELSEESDEVELRAVSATALEAEARRAGLEPVGRRAVPATDLHVGSVVCLFERRR